MKSILLMVIRFLVLVFILLTAQTAWAGNWVLDRYEVTQNYTDFYWQQNQNNPSYESYIENEHLFGGQGPQPINEVIQSPTAAHFIFSRVEVHAWGTARPKNPPRTTVRLTITPVYKWTGDQGEQPAPSFLSRERGSIYFGDHISGPSIDPQNPNTGQFVTIIESNNGFKQGLPHLREQVPNEYNAWGKKSDDYWYINKINATPGATEVKGPTRTLKIVLEINLPYYGNDLAYDLGATLEYEAEAGKFELGLDLGDRLIEEFGGRVNPEDPNSAKFTIPDNRYLAAYADGNWTNQWVANLTPPGPNASPEEIAEYEAHLAKPYKFFWDGNAGYSVNMSSNLSSMQVPAASESWPQYEWSQGDGGDISKDLVVTVPPPSDENDTQGFANLERQLLDTDTKTKDLHHNVQEYPVKNVDTESYSGLDATWPRTTHIKAKSNFSESVEFTQLESQAKIDWYGRPSTYYRIEVETDYVNLETGEEAPASVTFDDPADAYAQEVAAAKQEFFATFDQRVGMPLRMIEQAYLTGIEFVVPDEWDLVAAGVGPAGTIFKKSFKATKGAIKFVEFATKITTRVAARGDDILALGRAALNVANNAPVGVRTRYKLIRMRRAGKLANGEVREAVEMGEVRNVVRWLGPLCFAAGTKVTMADGTLKSIEQITIGDQVLSKDESTGQVVTKRIVNTMQREAPQTIVLIFENGERVETTHEHPFYEEHKGFTPAGLLAIGNSIVTRAGPPLTITAIERKTAATTVYNFTVEDFHTYFVGESQLWVHNQVCPATGKANEVAHSIVRKEFDGDKLTAFERSFPGCARPTTACGIEIPGVGIFGGHNYKTSWLGKTPRPDWDPDYDVLRLYDRVPLNERSGGIHGFCAEVQTLSEIFGHLKGQGYSAGQIEGILSSGKSRAVAIMADDKHSLKPACNSCRYVLKNILGMVDVF